MIDAVRGAAICLMIVYHFAFDLNLPWVGVLHTDFNNHLGWLAFRAVIVSAFLLTVGISLRLACEARVAPVRVWTRLVRVGLCAALVTVGSYLMFPRTFITFGILHCIVVCSLIAWPMAARPKLALALGVAAIAAGSLLRLPLFDSPALQWLGMMTHKPATEDYVPLLPWLGAVLLGIALAAQLRLRQQPALVSTATTPAWARFLGRHSLLVYMVHQPLLLGALWLGFGR